MKKVQHQCLSVAFVVRLSFAAIKLAVSTTVG